MGERPLARREAVLRITAVGLVLTAVAAVVIWDPLAGLARSLDVPDVLPVVPKWLLVVLGKAKYILLAVIVLLVAARRRLSSRKESP